MNTPIPLRNNSITYDPRLTRIKQFDYRSRAFPITATITATKPRSYTWACSAHLDQGSEGACVGFGWSHELIAKPAVAKNITDKFAKEKIYWEAQKIDEWSGGSYPGAKPQYEGTSVLAGAKVVKSLGYIKEYRWAFGLDDLIMAVGYKGPAVLGLDWYEGMYDTDMLGFIKPTGYNVGGHCILAKGVNIKSEYFLLHNSWGPQWGVGGDAKISFDNMDLLLRQGGEACIPTVRTTGKSLLDIIVGWFS